MQTHEFEMVIPRTQSILGEWYMNELDVFPTVSVDIFFFFFLFAPSVRLLGSTATTSSEENR